MVVPFDWDFSYGLMPMTDVGGFRDFWLLPEFASHFSRH
jgi:hypothetical protein